MTLSNVSRKAVEALPAFRLFGRPSEFELEHVAALCRSETYQVGEAIYSQDEIAESLYLIEDGVVTLIRPASGMAEKAAVTMDVLTKGRVSGWACLIRPDVHIASAICRKRAEVLIIDRATLRSILAKNPQAASEAMTNPATPLGDKLRAGY
jgi:CRP-like cAMP-binding protein